MTNKTQEPIILFGDDVFIRPIASFLHLVGAPSNPVFAASRYAEFAEREAATTDDWFGISCAGLDAIRAFAMSPPDGVEIPNDAWHVLTGPLNMNPVRVTANGWRLAADESLALMPVGVIDPTLLAWATPIDRNPLAQALVANADKRGLRKARAEWEAIKRGRRREAAVRMEAGL